MSFNQIAPATIQFRGVTPWDRYPWFSTLRPYTQLWIHNCYMTGTLTYREIQWAELYLAQPIYAAGIESKIVALYPFIGDLGAARCPLHDLRGVGPAVLSGSTGFTLSTLGTAALGMVTSASGSVQYLETNLSASVVAGVVTNGSTVPACGIGWYERNGTFTTSTSEPLGCYSQNQVGTQRFSIDLRSNKQAGSWCSSTNQPNVASAAGNSDYYCEASATTLRTLYKDGASIATNTTADGAGGAGQLTMVIGGVKTISSGILGVIGYGPGRGGAAYWTTGNLGSTGVAALHTILSNFCTVTGR